MNAGTQSRLFAIGVLCALLLPVTLVAQVPDYDELAKRIVDTSARIQPGDVVVVSGGTHVIPLMEAVAIEAQKKGGMVTLFLDSEKVQRSFYKDVPEQYPEQEPRFVATWLEEVDVWIGLPATENPKAVFADIPEERFANAARAAQFIIQTVNEANIAGVFIGHPSEEEATINQVDFPTYERMHWEAVNTDYEAIARAGRELKQLLENAQTVRVTSPAGTDLTFSVGDRPVFVIDGVVTEEDRKSSLFINRLASLPGGEVIVAPVETSANGKVVVPKDRCRYEPLTDVSFTLENGQINNFEAEQGEACFQEVMAAYTGPKDRFGSFGIGLNPALKVMEEGADYRPSEAAGMVWIGVGDNQMLGGENTVPGSFSFPITNATVEVDGRVVVQDGKLVLGTL